MINNRQNGRRRGRGGGGNGPRQGGGGQGQRDSGNRIDSRARGNAAQLLEKYRNMARDAQMSGDRVNTEYYLQFADHYFRVLADQRGRSEDQQPRARQRDDFDHFGGSFDTGFDNADDFADEGEAVRSDEQPRGNENEPRAAREPRRDEQRRDEPRRDDRRPRNEGRNEQRGEGRYDNRGENRYEPREDRQPAAEPQPAPVSSAPMAPAPISDVAAAEEAPRRRTRKPREDRAPVAAEPVAIEADRLPPAFGAPTGDAAASSGEDEAPKPRRRRVRTAAVEAPAEV